MIASGQWRRNRRQRSAVVLKPIPAGIYLRTRSSRHLDGHEPEDQPERELAAIGIGRDPVGMPVVAVTAG
jgi:hypothetical protein